MCIEDGCTRPIYVAARGLCRSHWRKARDAGTLGPKLTPSGRPAGAKCADPECDRTDIQGDGLCRMHYRRVWNAANREKVNAQARALRAKNPEKATEAQARWRAAHPEKARAARQIRYAENADRLRAERRAYYYANRDEERARMQAWVAANREKVCDNASRRRARRQANDERHISAKDLQRLYASPCFYCGHPGPVAADHVIPVSRGGRHAIGNLVPACRSCNSSKKDRTIMEWRVRLPQ